MNRVSDGDHSTLLSFVSCGASQGYAPQSGETIGILMVLFRYVGGMGWLTTREFVILVPDPIAFVLITRRPSAISLSSSSGRASLVSSVQTRHVSWSSLPGWARGQARVTGTSNRSQALSSRAGSERTPPGRGDIVVCSCVTLPSQDQPLVRRDEEVLDARAGHHPRVGAAQEEERYRRRAL